MANERRLRRAVAAPREARPETTRLAEVIRAMADLATSAEAPLDSVLRKIADLARQLARAQYAAVGVPNSEGYLEAFIVSGIDDEHIQAIDHWPKGLGLLGALIREQRPIRLANLGDDPRSHGFPPNHPPMTSFLGVPIHWQGRVLGNLYITNKQGAREFSEDDQQLVEGLAAHAAVAIENSRLYSQVRGLNVRLLDSTREAYKLAEEERKAREAAEALAHVARDVAAEADLSRLLKTLARRTRDLLGADLVGVATVEEETSRIVWRAADGNAEPFDAPLETPEGGGLAGRAIAARRPVVVQPGEPHQADELALLVREGIRVAVGVPLVGGEDTVGALVVGFRADHSITDREVSLAEALADHASIAIGNARLLESLRQLNHSREEEIKLISHDLRAPLTIILGQGQMLPRFIQAGNSASALKSSEAIVTGVKRMNSLIQDLVDAARLESGHVALHCEEVDLARFAADLRHRLSAIVKPERLAILADDGLPPVSVDTSRLDRILTNLLVNAVRYSPPDTKIAVRIAMLGSDEVLTSVIDEGVGLSAEQIAKLFRRFYRANETGGGDGLGLGLYITRKLVEAHGGRVWAESAGLGHGASFRFTLPVARPDGDSQPAG